MVMDTGRNIMGFVADLSNAIIDGIGRLQP
jgi:hypothetical protein